MVVAACDLSLLFTFVPGWSMDLFHCLLCLVALIDPVTSIYLVLLAVCRCRFVLRLPLAPGFGAP